MKNRRMNLALLPAFAAAILLAAAGAPVAVAQAPAGGDQYEPGEPPCPHHEHRNGKCHEHKGKGKQGKKGAGGEQAAGGGGAVGPGGGGGAAGPSVGAGEGDAGNLPFTGYPLTGLVLAFILLVGGALTVRLFSELRQRTRASRGASGR